MPKHRSLISLIGSVEGTLGLRRMANPAGSFSLLFTSRLSTRLATLLLRVLLFTFPYALINLLGANFRRDTHRL